MNFDFSVPGEATIDMVDYINDMVDDFSVKFKKNETTTLPVTENVLKWMIVMIWIRNMLRSSIHLWLKVYLCVSMQDQTYTWLSQH